MMANDISLSAYVMKQVPEHLIKKYQTVDPTKDLRVQPDIKPEDIPVYIRDPNRLKSTYEIPRVPDDKIHLELIPDNEFHHSQDHINDALNVHNIAKKLEQLTM